MKPAFTVRITSLIAASLVWLAAAGGLGAQPQSDLPNFDKRHSNQLRTRELEAEKAEGSAKLKQLRPGARIDWEPLLQTPKYIRSSHGFLGDPTAEIPGPRRAANQNIDRAEPVRRFLQTHRALFGHGAEALEAAQIKRDFTTSHNGLRTVVWNQQLDGIPVFQAALTAHISKRGELVCLSSQLVPDLEPAADRGTPQRKALQRTPQISAEAALVQAAQNIGEVVTLKGIRPVPDARADLGQLHKFTASQLRGPAEVSLVWLPLSNSELRLAWAIILTGRQREEMFRILVDAQTGEVWLRHCLTHYLTDATYRVFTSDSPSPFSPGHGMPLTNQPPIVPRALVTLGALSTNASPGGWINDGDNETLGNNVDAHLDANGDHVPDLPRPQGSPPRVFDFPLDLGVDPSQSGNAAVVQLFYWCNWMHDRLYNLGFTEAAGNFQKLNFGRGGLENDPVLASAQDSGRLNNASFSSPPDGSPGRMLVHLWDGPTPWRDGAFDAELILHEYTHGLSSRRVGAGLGLNELQSIGLGEGWSDFYALALLSESGDDPNTGYPFAAYSSYLLRGTTENYYYGIRRYPYSTDLLKNPLTFKDIDPLLASPHTGVPQNPALTGSSPEEVHRQGEVWCVTLWEARANLIAKWGFENGNERMLRLVTDALGLTPYNPNFTQARDAILLADLINHDGIDLPELWKAFAKRGLGASSSAPPSTTTFGIQEAFDLPDDLAVAALAGQQFRGPAGGPFQPEWLTYRVRNLGTDPLTWSATQNASWLSLAPLHTNLTVGDPSGSLGVFINPHANDLPPGTYQSVITFGNQTSGANQSFTVTLEVFAADHFTEQFIFSPIGSMDLGFQSLTFTPDGSPNFYAVCRADAGGFLTEPAGGTALALSDDTFAEVNLADGKQVSLYGRTANKLFVGSNGYITFDAGDTAFEETLAQHFDRPRLSALFRDLAPHNGGTISWRQLPDRAAITFQDVPEVARTNRNSFQIEMFWDGSLRVTWLGIGARNGIVGLSAGSGVPAGFVESDLSGYASCAPPLTLRLPAMVREGVGLLTGQGQLMIPAATGADVTFYLASSEPTDLQVPSAVTIRAGETSATFDLLPSDNSLLDLTRTVIVSAFGVGYRSQSLSVELQDDEQASLKVILPSSVTEGGSVAGTVTISSTAVSVATVHLVSSDTNQIQIPPAIVIPAGLLRATFPVTVLNNSLIDGMRTVTVTAHVAGWTDNSATFNVLDDDGTALMLKTPAEVTEGDGRLGSAGTVAIAPAMTNDLQVTLVSGDDSEITVPSFVTIPAGKTNATFDITVVDDAVLDGTQTVTLQASAVNFNTASTAIAVHDNETASLSLALPSEVTEGGPQQQATLRVSAGPTNDVIVSLASSDPAQLQVPFSLVIPGGQTNATFPLTIREDNDLLDGTQVVTVTAQVKNWTEGRAVVTVRDNDPAVLELAVPEQANEGSGLLSGAGQLRLRGVAMTNLTVALSVSDTNELLVPQTVTVSAGQSNAVFDLTIIDDNLLDGRVPVTITARAQGFADGQATLVVVDNDVHHFVFSPISSPQTSGIPFLVTIAAVDVTTNTILPFTNAVALRALSSGGLLPLQPTNTTSFSKGIWAGAVTLNVATTNVQLVADDGLTHTGTSAVFEVTAGAVARFEWNPIPSLQRTAVPFAATLTARDEFGNRVTGFADTVTLSALVNGDTAVVAFSPTALTNFVGGTWAGELVVQDAVTNLQFRAADALGHAGLGNTLDVILANDLALSLMGPSEPVVISNNFTVTLTVTNSGPLNATNVVVTNAVSVGANFVSARLSQGTFTNQENVFVAKLGVLTNSTLATIEITLRGALPGVVTNRAVVVRGEPDANVSNNAASVVLLITNLPPIVTLTHPTPQEKFFGPTGILLEATVSDSEGIARLEFFEGANRVGDMTSAPYRFFWQAAPPGEYTLSAVATDSLGATNTSPPVAISVGDAATNMPPQITTVRPAPGSVFNAASNGLSFSVVTVSPNVIPPNSVRLTLNGIEVTTSLSVSGDSTNRFGAFTDLASNTIYSAFLEVTDEGGRKASTEWTFDTFDVQSVRVIEVEDYNYSDGVCTNGIRSVAPHAGGLFQDNPPPSGFTTNGTQVGGNGIGYLGLVGMAGIDFSVSRTNVSTLTNLAYRPCDPVSISVATNEVVREKYQASGVRDYLVTQLQVGDWVNYTRIFTNRDYRVYLRASSTVTQEFRLGLIGGNRTTTNQTESPLGIFRVAPVDGTNHFAYTPLTELAGPVALVRLTNVQTLRLTALTTNGAAELNYLVFVPGSRTVPPTITGVTPLPNSNNVPPDGVVQITVANGDVPVNTNSIVLRFDESAVTPEITPTADGLVVTYRPPGLFTPNTTPRIQLTLRDAANPPNEVATNWTFTIIDLPVLPASFAAPQDSGGDRGFKGRIHKARNDAPSALFVGLNNASNTVVRAELQLSNQLIDPTNGLPFVNEASGPSGDGSFVLTNTVNFEQRGTNTGLFPGDVPFPWVTGSDPDFIAMELRTYLELTTGVYRFGVNYDDGFQLAVGANPSAATLVLSRAEGGGGEVTPVGPQEFEFVVLTNGLYGFRLLWWEGKGPAHLEWYARNRQSGERVLINSTNIGSIPAYSFRAVPAAISLVQPVNGSLLAPPADIALLASAVENDQPARAVSFFAGTNRIGAATSSPFSMLWTNVSSGSYSLTAAMIDRLGNAVTSAPVQIVVNATPTISAISNLNVVEHTLIPPISFTVADLETPASNLVVTASSSNTNLLPVANLLLAGTNSDRTLTLLPLTNQLGTATVTVIVADGFTNASRSFALTVASANLTPILNPIGSQTVDEGNTLSLVAVATDPDVPAQTLTFSLDPGAPEGMAIGATNGVVTWTPTEAQGPGTYLVTVRVTDSGSPSRSALQQFEVLVNEVNRAPVFAPIANQTVELGSTFVLTNVATDPDVPTNHLVFSLAPGAPAGTTIDAATGLLTWTPSEDSARRTNAITVRVTDDGLPPLSDEKTITVAVEAPLRILSVGLADQKVTLVWRALPGQTYQVQYKTDLRLASWKIASGGITATNFRAAFAEPIEAGHKLYRIVQAP